LADAVDYKKFTETRIIADHQSDGLGAQREIAVKPAFFHHMMNWRHTGCRVSSRLGQKRPLIEPPVLRVTWGGRGVQDGGVMKGFPMRLPVLALLLAAIAAPVAADDWKTDVSTCAGAYGALADQAGEMAAWAPLLGRSNLARIDWAARKARLLDGSPVYEAASGPYERNFKMMVLADRIDGTAKGAATVLELSQACDKAFKLSPSFEIPAS
jgi:hypothetical protein